MACAICSTRGSPAAADVKGLPMKIDFVSDVACPWCAVGLNSLEQALRELDGEIEVSLQFQPFELNPQMPPEGADTVDYLARKYGLSAAQIAQNQQAIRARGAAVGFTFGERPRVWNTFDAHRLLHWAGLQSPAAQRALKHALLEANHGQARNPGAHEVLVELAGAAGLDAAEAAQVLFEGRYADDVRAAEAQWQQAGISAVPSVVIDGRHLIQGGQPPEVFVQALRRLAA
jgi:predicted DsbA family dithiol-disulfide isomerase